MLIIGLRGEGSVTDLLVLSQVVLAMQLPLAMFPLLHFTSLAKSDGPVPQRLVPADRRLDFVPADHRPRSLWPAGIALQGVGSDCGAIGRWATANPSAPSGVFPTARDLYIT